MKSAKGILAAAAFAITVAPIASLANDIRPGNSLVSASAASSVAVQPQRAGASMNDANHAGYGKWVLITLAGGALIWVFIEMVTDEPESP